MSAPQPPADGRPRDDEPRSTADTSADGGAGSYEFHGEQLDFDPYRFGRPEEPAPTWGAPTGGGSGGGAPTPGDRWAPGGDPGTRDVRPGDYWDGAGSHRGPFPPAGYTPPPGEPSSPRVDLGKPGEPVPPSAAGGPSPASSPSAVGGPPERRDAWASHGSPYPPPTYPSAGHPAPGAYPGAPGPSGPSHGRGGNGLAIAGLVVGILGCLLAITSWPGILVGLVGLGLAIAGLVRARRTGSGRGLAIWGVVLSVAAVVLSSIVLVWVLSKVDFDCLVNANGDTSQVQECIR